MPNGCERIQGDALEAYRNEQPLPNDVVAHLQQCRDCRNAIAVQSRLWDELGKLPVPQPAPAQTEHLAQQLRQAILTRPKESSTMKLTWLAAAALAGALFGSAGTRMLQRDEVTPAAAPAAAPAEAAAGGQYVLLLHEDARRMTITPEQVPAVVAEYSAWARNLNEQQRLVSAEKLRDDGGRWINTDGALMSVDRAESVGGYFIIRAASYEEAVNIARQSPHLKYGGTIEVRGIEDTSGN